jgi:hypothetical protein
MKRSTALTIAGAGIGALVGSSMGVAAFGGAVNAAWVFGPLGAFVGWLVSGRLNDRPGIQADMQSTETLNSDPQMDSPDRTHPLAKVMHSALMLMAYLWNFHVAALDRAGLLDTFVRQPLLFLGFCVLISFFFPPFLGVYFFSWLASSHFNATEESRYYADIP